VVKALSKIKTPEAFRSVSQALTDEDMEVRASAVLSLGMTGDESHVEDLVLLLDDPEDMVKVSAAKALGSLGSGAAVPALVRLLSDGNGFVVTAAIDALGRLGGEDAGEALKSMLSSPDREIRRSAITALARFGGVEEKILPFVGDRDWALRVAAVESLTGHRGERVRAEVERAYDLEEDPVVKSAMEKYLNA
jgi:HEAT repeat protein